MFNKMRTSFYLSHIEQLIKSLMDQYGFGTEITQHSTEISREIVMENFAANQNLFDGSLGKKPHKLVFASFVFAASILHLEKVNGNRDVGRVMILALGSILLDLQDRSHIHALTSRDHSMIEFGMKVHIEFAPSFG